MNWLNLLLFVVLYSASCLPMWAAGRTDDLRQKTMFCIVDAALSIMSYIYLWYAFPSTLYSLGALVVFLTSTGYLGRWMRERGYNPYAGVGVKAP